MNPVDVHQETNAAAQTILAEAGETFGSADFVYGGSIWVFDPEAPHGPWKVYRNYLGFHPNYICEVGVERIEALRQHAESLINVFPLTLDHLERVGATHATAVLTHPVRGYDDAIVWAYSIWNAALPVNPGVPQVGAFPWYLAVERDGFQPLHSDIQGHLIVAPDADNSGVVVLWSTEGGEYLKGQHLGPRHPISITAYGRGRRKK